jgi:hypothetical protein
MSEKLKIGAIDPETGRHVTGVSRPEDNLGDALKPGATVDEPEGGWHYVTTAEAQQHHGVDEASE